jgi:L-asparaginase
MIIKIFTTGGSIDKQYSTLESAFVVGSPAVEGILQEANVTADYEIEPLMRKDSLDITPQDRLLIAKRADSDRHQRIVITHGTDTIIETAQALRSCHQKTIVLTGAMQPEACTDSDAAFNVGTAFMAAQTLPAGVYIAMNGQLFDPDTVTKNAARNRFEQPDGSDARP